MLEDPLAFPFSMPVDPVALNLPLYTTVVKEPMDLGTVRQKLSNKKYPNATKFQEDVERTFENCFKFNADDSQVVGAISAAAFVGAHDCARAQIYADCIALQKKFRQLYTRVIQAEAMAARNGSVAAQTLAPQRAL